MMPIPEVVGLKDELFFVAGTFDVDQMHARLNAEAERLGGVDLVVVDTSAAYFLQDNENDNAQMGSHARMLRRLTTLPGGPCVLVLCHPIKNAQEPSQLLPRGGGAFLAEMDGNLTIWKKEGGQIELWHNKMRGPGFEPLTFKLETISCDRLIDTKGRNIPTVRAVPMNAAEEEPPLYQLAPTRIDSWQPCRGPSVPSRNWRRRAVGFQRKASRTRARCTGCSWCSRRPAS